MEMFVKTIPLLFWIFERRGWWEGKFSHFSCFSHNFLGLPII